MHNEAKSEGVQHDAAIRAVVARAALGVLAEMQSRGAVVSRELLVDCFIAAAKQWLDSPEAHALVGSVTNAAFDKWNAVSEARAN